MEGRCRSSPSPPGKGSRGKCSTTGEPAWIPDVRSSHGLSALWRASHGRSVVHVRPPRVEGEEHRSADAQPPGAERVRTGAAADDAGARVLPRHRHRERRDVRVGQIAVREGLPDAALQPRSRSTRSSPSSWSVRTGTSGRCRSSCWTWTTSRRSTTGTATRRGTAFSRWWRAHWGPTCGRRTSRRDTGGRVRGDPSGDRPFLRGGDRGAYRRGDLERPAGHRRGERHLLHREHRVRLLRPRRTRAGRDPEHRRPPHVRFEAAGPRRRARDSRSRTWRPNGPECRRAVSARTVRAHGDGRSPRDRQSPERRSRLLRVDPAGRRGKSRKSGTAPERSCPPGRRSGRSSSSSPGMCVRTLPPRNRSSPGRCSPRSSFSRGTTSAATT